MRRAHPLRFVCLALLATAAACRTPPQVDDRSSPVGAYETFRGALARGEHDREWPVLSDHLRRKLGIRSRAEWRDARTLVLTQGHILVKGITQSEVDGPTTTLEDGRVAMNLDFPFGYSGRVWMRPAVTFRVWGTATSQPMIYEVLEGLELTAAPDGVLVSVPPDLMGEIDALFAPGERYTRLEAAVEWFLDDYAFGDESPESARREMEQEQS